MNRKCKQIVSLFLYVSMFLCLSSFWGNDKNNNDIKEEQANNFRKYFPDKSLALLVAERLGKKIDDKVTIKELASIKGYFNVSYTVADLKGIGYLVGIDTFDCSKNEVRILPAEIGKLKKLVYLDLCKAYYLERIPAEIGQLKKLKKIRLALTEVSSIPKEIGDLEQLEILDICCNQLSDIPKEIGQLKNLVELDIHSNKIGKIPDEICNLTALTSLDLSHCGLKKIPENIGNLKKLKRLNLFNNDLRYLPKSIANLTKLKELNIYDNFKLSENYKRYLPKSLKSK